MQYLNISITALILSTAVTYGILFFILRRLKVGTSAERDTLIEEIQALDTEIRAKLEVGDFLATKLQVDNLNRKLQEFQEAFSQERRSLERIESKLEVAQREVETKESQQQEIKSAKYENEAVLSNLLANYAEVSNESILLEQNLASSLKHLDSILNELELSQEARALLEALSEALSEAGSRLRDLITEYDGVKKRLDLMQQQHHDLEEEYTKLVEQQLGG